MSRRFALVIGNESYNDPELNTGLVAPKNDVEELARLLGDPKIGEFNVTCLVDQGFTEVRDAIAQLLTGKDSEDTVLLYFSGHGIKKHGEVYLAVRDTSNENPNARGIDENFVGTAMKRCRSERQILILDCCYSGAWVGDKAAKEGAEEDDCFLGSGYGHVRITATSRVERAQEAWRVSPQSKYSLFTHYLVEGLSTGAADGFPNNKPKGTINESELYEYAYKRVCATQTPKREILYAGPPIVLARNRLFNDIHPDLRKAIDDIRDPSRFVRASGASVLGDFLTDRDPEIVLLAKINLERLKNDASELVRTAAHKALEKLAPPPRPSPVPLPEPPIIQWLKSVAQFVRIHRLKFGAVVIVFLTFFIARPSVDS